MLSAIHTTRETLLPNVQASAPQIATALDTLPYELTLIPVSRIQVDHEVQQAFRPSRAAELFRKWSEAHAEPIKVNERAPGEIFVFDGQHRLHAYRLMKRQVVPCLLYRGMTRDEEGRAFVHLNTYKVLRAAPFLERFRVRLNSHDPEALALVSTIEAVGLAVSLTNNESPRSITAVETLEYLAKRLGHDGLAHVLQIATGVYPETHLAIGRDFLRGLGAFYARHASHIAKHDGWPAMIARLKSVPLDSLIRSARTFATENRVDLAQGIAATLVTIHDKRLRADSVNRIKKLERFE